MASSDFYLLLAATAGAQREAAALQQARTRGQTNRLFSPTGLVGGFDIKGPLERLELSAL